MDRARWNSDYMQTYRFRNESRFRSEHSAACSHAAHAFHRLRRGSAPTNRAGQIDRPYGGDKGTWKPIPTFDGRTRLENVPKPWRIPRRRLLRFRVGCGRITEQEEKSWHDERSRETAFLFPLRRERDPALIRIGLRQARLSARSINLVHMKAVVSYWLNVTWTARFYSRVSIGTFLLFF